MLNGIKFYAFLIFFIISFSFQSFSTNSNVEVKEMKSKYDIKLLFIEKPSSPLLYFGFVFKDSGYAYDEENKQGLANIAKLILQEGTIENDAINFSKELAKIGASITFNIDAENFYIYLTVLPENIKGAFDLLYQLLFSPRLDDLTLKKVKDYQNQQREIESQDPNHVAIGEFFKIGLSKTAYSNCKYGNYKTLEKITIDDLKDYFTNAFNRIKLGISAVGDIKREVIEEILDQYIINLPLTVMKVKKMNQLSVKKSNSYNFIKLNVPQNVIIFGRDGIAINNEDFYKFAILNHILGGAPLGSLLSKSIRVENGYTYGINTFIYNSSNLNLLLGKTSTTGNTSFEVVVLIKKIISDLHNNGVSLQILESAKNYILKSFILNFDKSEDALEKLIYIQKNNLQKDYFDTYLSGIQSVTLEELNEFIKKFLKPEENFLFINVGEVDR